MGSPATKSAAARPLSQRGALCARVLAAGRSALLVRAVRRQGILGVTTNPFGITLDNDAAGSLVPSRPNAFAQGSRMPSVRN